MDEKEDREREGREEEEEREGGSKGSPYFLGTQSSPSVNLDSCTIR